MKPIIRKAITTDAPLLSEIALRSKGYWGYDAGFIEACREDLLITTKYIEENPVYVLEESSRIIGFYSFLVREKESKLDFLYLDPEVIGKGIGKRLWTSLIETATNLGIKTFTLDSDPHAEGFYKKMGAIRIGEIASTVFPNRKLPLLRVTVVNI